MLTNKNDAEIERLMNEEGLSHSEAMDRMKSKKKSTTKPMEEKPDEEETDSSDEGDTETITLPADLVPSSAVGKDIDISISGTVKSKSNGMVEIETRSTNVGTREPMKNPPTLGGPK